MSNRFTQQAVAAFLLEQGCPDARASFISNFVVTALRSVSINAEIASQTINEDFTAYRAEVAANGGNGFVVDYTVNRLGPGFYDHRAKVTTAEAEYTVTRLIHEPMDVVEEVAAPVATEVVVEEAPVAAAVVEDAPAVEAELNDAWTAPVVAEISEEVAVTLEQAVVEAAAEDAPAEVEAPAEEEEEAAEKPKKKVKKAKAE